MKWNKTGEVEMPPYTQLLAYYKEWDSYQIVNWIPKKRILVDDVTLEIANWPDFWALIDKPDNNHEMV